jgi:hypothetical protein
MLRKYLKIGHDFFLPKPSRSSLRLIQRYTTLVRKVLLNNPTPGEISVSPAASMKMAVFWVVASCCALMMKTESTSETSVNFYQTIWRNNP